MVVFLMLQLIQTVHAQNVKSNFLLCLQKTKRCIIMRKWSKYTTGQIMFPLITQLLKSVGARNTARLMLLQLTVIGSATWQPNSREQHVKISQLQVSLRSIFTMWFLQKIIRCMGLRFSPEMICSTRPNATRHGREKTILSIMNYQKMVSGSVLKLDFSMAVTLKQLHSTSLPSSNHEER